MILARKACGVTRAAETAGQRCRTEFCAAPRRKSATRGIFPYCHEFRARQDPASQFPKEPCRRSHRCAERIPSGGAAECPKYPCTYSDDGEPEKMLRSSRAAGRREPE